MHEGKNLNIEIGIHCTLQCSECQRTIFKKEKRSIPGKDMTIEQFDKISDFFKGRRINFCGTFSDPIFNKDFIEMLKMCKAKNIKPFVSTAASHKSEEWYLKAFEANYDATWIFGIDGLPHESHLYRVNQDGIKLFDIMLKAKSLNIKAVWQYLVFDYNKNNVHEAMELAKTNELIIDIIRTSRNESMKNVKTHT
jgi:MoaA/NifB/PqqE/SkfB family radical SAM enzyme